MDKAIQSAFTAIPEINFKALTDYLQPTIVEMYDGTDFVEYRAKWITQMKDYAKQHGFDFTKAKANWETIDVMVIQKLVANGYSWQETSVSPIRRASSTSTSCSASTSVSDRRSSSSAADTVSSDMTSVKQIKLTEEDKQRIKRLYAGLDKAKMWRLSTGTLVEEQMEKLAITQDFEHLAHSLTLDVQDSCWNHYFTEAEIKEIRYHRAVQLPVLPFDMKTYLDEIQTISKNQLYEKVNQDIHAADSNEKWVQDVYNSCFRLIRSGFFPLHDVTEQGIGKRMWSCVDSCFDFSSIRCITGEKCSKASADAANMSRSRSDFTRQQAGRKMDYLFKTKDSDVEIGCGECALVGGVNTTKEFQDAGFKMPKVMRDMMHKIVSRSPALLHKLHISGVYMGENVFKLLILDCPAGYVTRYDGFLAVEFPMTENAIRVELPALLTMIMSARIIMEDCKQVLDNDDSKAVLGRSKIVVMEPCFVSEGVNYKKRKY